MASAEDEGFRDVCSTMQVPKSGVFFASVGAREILLARDAKGDIVAHSGFCTHSIGRLEGGRIEGDEITCPHHGARFNFRTGRAMTACPNLPRYEVRIAGRRVLVRLNR